MGDPGISISWLLLSWWQVATPTLAVICFCHFYPASWAPGNRLLLSVLSPNLLFLLWPPSPAPSLGPVWDSPRKCGPRIPSLWSTPPTFLHCCRIKPPKLLCSIKIFVETLPCKYSEPPWGYGLVWSWAYFPPFFPGNINAQLWLPDFSNLAYSDFLQPLQHSAYFAYLAVGTICRYHLHCPDPLSNAPSCFSIGHLNSCSFLLLRAAGIFLGVCISHII